MINDHDPVMSRILARATGKRQGSRLLNMFKAPENKLCVWKFNLTHTVEHLTVIYNHAMHCLVHTRIFLRMNLLTKCFHVSDIFYRMYTHAHSYTVFTEDLYVNIKKCLICIDRHLHRCR